MKNISKEKLNSYLNWLSENAHDNKKEAGYLSKEAVATYAETERVSEMLLDLVAKGEFDETKEPDRDHYNDGYIDVRWVQEFKVFVLTSNEGITKTIAVDDNLFAPIDMLWAYKDLMSGEWALSDAKKETLISDFKKYLVSTGIQAEELEEE